MNKIFDLHFHFLYKHYVSTNSQIGENIEIKGFAKLLDTIFGGPFDSQCSPKQIKNSQLYLGVAAILSVEHAYANRILHILGIDFSSGLPLDKELFRRTRDGLTTYYEEFKNQVNFCAKHQQEMADPQTYAIEYLRRDNFAGMSIQQIEDKLTAGDKRYIIFSIEGGHNLSNVPIHGPVKSQFPEAQLKEIQDSSPLDFISINLCHLSEIPEQSLGVFAQGVNKLSQIAFHSEDFMPSTGLGITQSGKKVIRQALTHPTRPILIDVKHMSLYTRFHYYRFREALIQENAQVENLPILSSHSGFTFTSVDDYISNKAFRSSIFDDSGKQISIAEPENRKIGRTNDRINSGLFCNPWTINLFDEDIIEIMQSRGMIGIILDQRVLGASNPGVDSLRDKYYEGEHLSRTEWEKLFRDGQLPGAEALEFLKNIAPSRPERHIMLFCLHIVYAVQLGYSALNWLEGTSPWDCICLGSDYDGLINPINGFESIDKCNNLHSQLKKYLPQADKFLVIHEDVKALRYNDDGTVKGDYLEQVLNAFLYENGVKFITRFLGNWRA